jgi:hypothetical protein
LADAVCRIADSDFDNSPRARQAAGDADFQLVGRSDTARLVQAQRDDRRRQPADRLLLCTRKDHSLVGYALADLPNRLFVSKYQLELPTRDQLQKFLDAQLKEVGDA